MRTQYYSNGKYNRSAILKNAWSMVKHRPEYFTLSQALKIVWGVAKNQKKEFEYSKNSESNLDKISKDFGFIL